MYPGLTTMQYFVGQPTRSSTGVSPSPLEIMALRFGEVVKGFHRGSLPLANSFAPIQEKERENYLKPSIRPESQCEPPLFFSKSSLDYLNLQFTSNVRRSGEGSLPQCNMCALSGCCIQHANGESSDPCGSIHRTRQPCGCTETVPVASARMEAKDYSFQMSTPLLPYRYGTEACTHAPTVDRYPNDGSNLVLSGQHSDSSSPVSYLSPTSTQRCHPGTWIEGCGQKCSPRVSRRHSHLSDNLPATQKNALHNSTIQRKGDQESFDTSGRWLSLSQPEVPSCTLNWAQEECTEVFGNYPTTETVLTQLDASNKPPFSYITLIVSAMSSKPSKQITLSEIYAWIMSTFSYYRKNTRR
ncbi:unnamed protein product [Dicrocoelium dendriticum]|nr:unnamed protein product [Dicrocoelium dendriticum]